MRRIIVSTFVSLDGVMQAPGGPEEDPTGDFKFGGWVFPHFDAAAGNAMGEIFSRPFDLLLGRHTYDLWSGYWPKVKGGPFADALNAATKYVVTHRPTGLEWGPVEAVGSDIAEGVRRVKSTEGPDLLVWGSTTITPVLFEKGLVDEVGLVVYPVLLGRGVRFFSDRANPRELAFVNTKSTPTGVLINTYRHVGAPRAAS